jgi:hypothetical protein
MDLVGYGSGNSRYYQGISLKELRKTTKPNLSVVEPVAQPKFGVPPWVI